MINFLKGIVLLVVGVVSTFLGLSTNPTQEFTPPRQEIPQEEIVVSNATSTENVVEKNQPTKSNHIKTEESKPKITVKSEPEVIVNESVNSNNSLNLVVNIPSPIETQNSNAAEINVRTREALVNIICTTKQGGLLQPITGSGITIDERGVILTNAHIGQYYLLKDLFVKDFLECLIRTGSPATNTYRADLLFISPTWVKENYQKITSSNPKGTGENDFALLLIRESTNLGTALPLKFPFVPLDLRDLGPSKGDDVLVAGYPAGFLGGQAIQKDLHAVSTITKVMDVFTFTENSLDLFSLGGSIAAQKGSSGGGIVSLESKLLGIVVTASDAIQTDDRDLRAITLSHINKSIKKDTGVGLNDYLFGDLVGKSSQFREFIAPDLKKLLEGALGI